MNKKAEIIAAGAYLNAVVQLPMTQVAAIDDCSPQYVSQVCRSHGLKIDEKRGVIQAPLGVINKIFWPRPKE